MVLELHDTIAAVGTAAGSAARGVVRVSGRHAIDSVAALFSPADPGCRWKELRAPSAIPGTIHSELEVPCTLFVWPTRRSYTRQPTVEIHTFGSAPVLECVLAAVCEHGARLAEPGEFTLRAFLAGRIDLTQAEAVLGVIDARGERDFDAALTQLAGGLSRPLAELREQLVQVLAELEAGLDFVEEDIEFISRHELERRFAEAERTVAAITEQMAARGAANEVPRVVLSGPPNAGKSSLFNALVAHYGAAHGKTSAIVSAQPGTTRDYLATIVDLAGLACELIDTAGTDAAVQAESIESAAQYMSGSQRQQADLVVHCVSSVDPLESTSPSSAEIYVATKCDLLPGKSPPAPWLSCSSLTGDGLSEVASAIQRELADAAGGGVRSTALRCGESLRGAREGLASAVRLVESRAGEELIAAEVRHALDELGRVVGAVYTDDLLDRIFSQFCIGK